ncbi:MAG: hypothetical protein ACI37J_10600 [Candidatus Bruticola sp.]
MTSRNKNIFAFATFATTAALGTALFSAGCGDSGDTTPAFVSPDKAANAIALYYDEATQATFKNSKIDSLRWIITDNKTGKRLAIGNNAQAITFPTEKTTDADKDSSVSTAKEETANDKCYVVLQMDGETFKNAEDVTVAAIYYNEKDEIAGFGSNSDIEWNYDESKNKFNGQANANFFSEDVARFSSEATPKIIAKDGITTLSCKVAPNAEYANPVNIIGLVKVELDEGGDKYIQAVDNGIPGQYKGIAYTDKLGIGVQPSIKTPSGNQAYGTPIYVTDRKVTAFKISGGKALIPEKVDAAGTTPAVDYALGQTKAKGTIAGTQGSIEVTYGVRQASLEAIITDWDTDTTKGEIPANGGYFYLDGVTYTVKDGTSVAKDVAVADGVVSFNQKSLSEAKAFTVEGTYKGELADSKGLTSNATVEAIPATVEVGFGQEAKATDGTTSIAKDFTTEVEGDSNKNVTASLKMYARFVTGGVGGFTSYLFEIPSTAGFTYPSTAALFDADSKIYNAKDATVIIATAEQQKANDYSVTIKKDNQKNNLNVKFVEKDTIPYTEQIKAFGAFTKLNIQNLLDLVIAPETQVDPTPSPTPGGNPDHDAGDQP